MKTVKLPKFQWGRIDELNAGHTKEEWGEIEDSGEDIIEMQEIRWNKDEN